MIQMMVSSINSILAGQGHRYRAAEIPFEVLNPLLKVVVSMCDTCISGTVINVKNNVQFAIDRRCSLLGLE
jgi:hypothetical protein